MARLLYIVYPFLRYLLMLLALPALAFAPIAHGAVNEKDVLVVGRVIGLLDHAPKGNVAIAIVMPAGGNADSSAMLNLIGEGKPIGGLTLNASSLNVDQLDTTNARIIFLPEGLSESELTRVFAIASRRKLVTISNDDACLKLQKCAISFSSQPAVDIRLSASASSATSVAFGSTFRMIIKEVE